MIFQKIKYFAKYNFLFKRCFSSEINKIVSTIPDLKSFMQQQNKPPNTIEPEINVTINNHESSNLN